jgi:hypothetical protein
MMRERGRGVLVIHEKGGSWVGRHFMLASDKATVHGL